MVRFRKKQGQVMTITRLVTALSRERIQPYQDYIKRHIPSALPAEISQKALDLYIWNIQISSALFEIISFYEVTLRNKVFNVIDKNQHFSIQNHGFLKSLPTKVREKFHYVITQIKAENKPVSNHLIVSRLSFSVWNSILIKHMSNPNSHLYKHRKEVFGSYVKNVDYWIKKLISINSETNNIRNRICHHEHLLNKNIVCSHLKMLVILKKLDNNIFSVVRKHQRVTENLRNLNSII